MTSEVEQLRNELQREKAKTERLTEANEILSTSLTTLTEQYKALAMDSATKLSSLEDDLARSDASAMNTMKEKLTRLTESLESLSRRETRISKDKDVALSQLHDANDANQVLVKQLTTMEETLENLTTQHQSLLVQTELERRSRALSDALAPPRTLTTNDSAVRTPHQQRHHQQSTPQSVFSARGRGETLHDAAEVGALRIGTLESLKPIVEMVSQLQKLNDVGGASVTTARLPTIQRLHAVPESTPTLDVLRRAHGLPEDVDLEMKVGAQVGLIQGGRGGGRKQSLHASTSSVGGVSLSSGVAAQKAEREQQVFAENMAANQAVVQNQLAALREDALKEATSTPTNQLLQNGLALKKIDEIERRNAALRHRIDEAKRSAGAAGGGAAEKANSDYWKRRASDAASMAEEWQTRAANFGSPRGAGQ